MTLFHLTLVISPDVARSSFSALIYTSIDSLLAHFCNSGVAVMGKIMATSYMYVYGD